MLGYLRGWGILDAVKIIQPKDGLIMWICDGLCRCINRSVHQFQVRIFALMDEPILDAICERLRQKTYTKGSKILYHGGVIEKMVFIVRGKMESIGEDGISVPLSEGDACGEELFIRCLEHSSVNKGMPLICFFIFGFCWSWTAIFVSHFLVAMLE